MKKYIYESTPKTLFVMKMSEKFKIEEDGERTILKGGGLGDLQEREPRSGRAARRRSHLVPKDETLRKDFS